MVAHAWPDVRHRRRFTAGAPPRVRRPRRSEVGGGGCEGQWGALGVNRGSGSELGLGGVLFSLAKLQVLGPAKFGDDEGLWGWG